MEKKAVKCQRSWNSSNSWHLNRMGCFVASSIWLSVIHDFFLESMSCTVCHRQIGYKGDFRFGIRKVEAKHLKWLSVFICIPCFGLVFFLRGDFITVYLRFLEVFAIVWIYLLMKSKFLYFTRILLTFQPMNMLRKNCF